MITVKYREPGDFLSDQPPSEMKKAVVEGDVVVDFDDGWVKVSTKHGELRFAVMAHMVVEITGS